MVWTILPREFPADAGTEFVAVEEHLAGEFVFGGEIDESEIRVEIRGYLAFIGDPKSRCGIGGSELCDSFHCQGRLAREKRWQRRLRAGNSAPSG